MSESQFLALVESTLTMIESGVDRLSDRGDIDIEYSRSGNVLELEFVENGSKIIINSQAFIQELWVAARSGGFHYKYDGRSWINTRDGSELFSSLSAMMSEQAGVMLRIRADFALIA